MIGRIVRPIDFERVLGTPSRARSVHFAVHHVAANPARPSGKVNTAVTLVAPNNHELSTASALMPTVLVDDAAPTAPDGCWLGLVVPKRHARRAVTRNLIKRQIRHIAIQALQMPSGKVAPGLWVVKLRAPFDRQRFTSPGSDALRDAAGEELGAVLRQAVRRLPGA